METFRVKYKKPRILAIDLGEKSVLAIRRAGFEVFGGSTGLKGGLFSVPCEHQDIEIAICQVEENSFLPSDPARSVGSQQVGQTVPLKIVPRRFPHKNSLHKVANFPALFLEIWARFGWIIFFVKGDHVAKELASIGIKGFGVHSHGGTFSPTSATDSDFPVIQPYKVEHSFDAPELAALLDRRLKNVKLRVLAKANASFSIFDVTVHPRSYDHNCLLFDSASEPNGLAFAFGHEPEFEEGECGGVMVLPDFGEKNVDVALSIIQEILPHKSRHLFESLTPDWLGDFLPPSAVKIQQEIDSLQGTFKNKLSLLENKKAVECKKNQWHIDLLATQNDVFQKATSGAFLYLGFSVQEVDSKIPEGEQRKEDFYLSEGKGGWFGLGEASSTARGGPKESFIDDVEKYQRRYSHEKKCEPPPAILVVNHSITTHPSDRHKLFYPAASVQTRCVAHHISAVDSYALHQLCTSVFSGDLSKVDARVLLKKPGVHSTFS